MTENKKDVRRTHTGRREPMDGGLNSRRYKSELVMKTKSAILQKQIDKECQHEIEEATINKE